MENQFLWIRGKMHGYLQTWDTPIKYAVSELLYQSKFDLLYIEDVFQ